MPASDSTLTLSSKPASTVRPWLALLVLSLGLALRAVWALLVPLVPSSDSLAYHNLALNLASGHGYAFTPGIPSAFWPVGTSAILAGVYKLCGVQFGPVVVLNIAISLASIWLLMKLTTEWFGRRAGLIAGLLLAAWPGQVQFSTVIASELPFNLLVLLAIYCESRDRWPTALRVVATGAAVAAATYVRPLTLVMPLLFWWIRLLDPDSRSRKRSAYFAETIGVVAVMALLILPWTLRNARTVGGPALISTNGGSNLWMGNNPDSDGGYMPLPEWVYQEKTEYQRDHALKQAARKYILDHPAHYLVMSARRTFMTFTRENIGVNWNIEGIQRTLGKSALTPLKALSSGYFLVALFAGLAGTALAFARLGWQRWLVLRPVLFCAFFAAVPIFMVGGDRYHYPCVPFIASLAAFALTSLRPETALNAEAPSQAS